MGNYIKPGVYVKEIDLSAYVYLHLEYPEFEREVIDYVSEHLNCEHVVNYGNTKPSCYSYVRNDESGQRTIIHYANVKFYVDFVEVQACTLDTRIGYQKPTFLEDLIDVVSKALHYNLPFHWKNVMGTFDRAVKDGFIEVSHGQCTPAQMIESQEQMQKIFGKPQQ